MTDQEKNQRTDESAMMKLAARKREITLETLRHRFKCTGQEAFSVIHGITLEGELRDKIFNFLCPPPPPAPPKPVEPPPEPEPVVPPSKPVVADFITPPSKRRAIVPTEPKKIESTAPTGYAGYVPPKPEPVEPAKIELLDEKSDVANLPPSTEATPSPTQPVAPGTVSSREKANPEVGARIRAAMLANGLDLNTLAPLLGHSSASNISAALGKSGKRLLQIRLCRMFALDDNGIPIPGEKPSLKAPPVVRTRTNLHAAIKKQERPKEPHLIPSGVKLPQVPRATDRVPATLLNGEQTAAAFELASAAVEYHRTTKENNAAALRYRRALDHADSVGVRFTTVAV